MYSPQRKKSKELVAGDCPVVSKELVSGDCPVVTLVSKLVKQLSNLKEKS